jgi:hypothetical protein
LSRAVVSEWASELESVSASESNADFHSDLYFRFHFRSHSGWVSVSASENQLEVVGLAESV